MMSADDVTSGFGIEIGESGPFGWFKARLRINLFERLKSNPSGKSFLVTAVTPTPYAEGNIIGLSQ